MKLKWLTHPQLVAKLRRGEAITAAMLREYGAPVPDHVAGALFLVGFDPNSRAQRPLGANYVSAQVGPVNLVFAEAWVCAMRGWPENGFPRHVKPTARERWEAEMLMDRAKKAVHESEQLQAIVGSAFRLGGASAAWAAYEAATEGDL